MHYKFALVGNPNCGKTTTFNEITGSTQYVGNWPGVTVEKKREKQGNLKKTLKSLTYQVFIHFPRIQWRKL